MVESLRRLCVVGKSRRSFFSQIMIIEHEKNVVNRIRANKHSWCQALEGLGEGSGMGVKGFDIKNINWRNNMTWFCRSGRKKKMIRIQGFNHQLQKGSYPFTSLFVSLLPVSLLSDLTDEKYTRFQNPGIFSDFKFTYENKGMKKKKARLRWCMVDDWAVMWPTRQKVKSHLWIGANGKNYKWREKKKGQLDEYP